MKRRHFLSAAALFSLLAPEAWAARNTKSSKSTGKSSAAKPARGSSGSAKPARKGRGGRASRVTADAPTASRVHTADEPVIERPPAGTTATRLPPARAPEPPDEWRTWAITTTVNLRSTRPTRFWLPLPLNQDTLYQRTLGHEWSGNADAVKLSRLPDGDLELLYAEWKNSGEAKLQLTTQVTTADRHFDITKRTVPPEREDILRRNLQASKLIPNDGLAHQLGERIVGRIKDPVAQAKAVYDWVIDNSQYDPSLPGCGTGDVRRQLINGRYGGRSADINGLFVAICRAIGIPARCVYGLRVGPSRLTRSLGLTSESATQAQHVRAEFYIPGYGWIPVDPSDVRRAIGMEALTDRDPRLGSLRRVLFGIWEMNWIALNVGADITLPGKQAAQPFLVLPQLEASTDQPPVSGGMHYAIKARQIEI